MRYDACVVGAGADGLAAAITLAGAGLKAVIVERQTNLGGRLVTREFHPGFHAPPFCDEIAPIPDRLFWSLDLARRGVFFVPSQSVAFWPGRQNRLGDAGRRIAAEAARLREEALARAADAATTLPKRSFFRSRGARQPPWSGEVWSSVSLAELLAARMAGEDEAMHLAALALMGRTADSHLGGSALHLLAPGAGGSGIVSGGLGALAAALESGARHAGVEIRAGLEASDVRRKRGLACGVALADGSEIEARAVLSTLDLKRTFLSLFQWSDLPPPLVKRAAGFRTGGGTARVLLALGARPRLEPALLRGPIFVSPDQGALAASLAACRRGAIPEWPPAVLRVVSALDPALAPSGQATLTVTFGCIPQRLFDGGWTKEKRDVLRDRALAAGETVMPGLSERVLAAEVIAPPDFEEMLGATGGDLWGGEIAPDQMFANRPFADPQMPKSPRTPLEGLYLAGPSSAAGVLGTCVSGVIAASAIIADIRAGRLK